MQAALSSGSSWAIPWRLFRCVSFYVSLALLWGMLLSCLGIAFGFRLNLSPSVPLGLYRLHEVPTTLTYGQLVVLDVPDAMRPWHSRWISLLKPVAGLPGDVVRIQDGTFYVNGGNYGPVHAQAAGRPLPQIAATHRLGASEVCLASSAPKSLDCRYMGPTPRSALKAVATPIWTWR